MTRRRLGAGAIGLAAMLGLALGGCAQNNTPDTYNTLVEQNFLETCTNRYFDNVDDTLSITDNTVTQVSTAPDQNVCTCMYQVFAGPNQDGVGGMPINSAAEPEGYTGPNFTDLNSDLKNDPEKAWAGVPEATTNALTACSTSGGTSSTSGGGGSTTTSTTAAPDTSTTAG